MSTPAVTMVTEKTAYRTVSYAGSRPQDSTTAPASAATVSPSRTPGRTPGRRSLTESVSQPRPALTTVLALSREWRGHGQEAVRTPTTRESLRH
jgi:hypothetical protein